MADIEPLAPLEEGPSSRAKLDEVIRRANRVPGIADEASRAPLLTRTSPAAIVAGTRPDYVADADIGVSVSVEGSVLYVLPVWGQSLAGNDCGEDGVPGDALADQPLYPGRALMPSSGIRVNDGLRSHELVDAREATVATAFGFSSETIVTAMLSALAAKSDEVDGSKRPRFCGFVSAQGGMAYRQLKRGSAVYQNLLATLADIVVLADEQNMRVVVPGLCVIHGETHTDDGTTADAYFGMLRQLADQFDEDVRRLTQQSGRALIYLSQTAPYAPSTNLDHPIQQAQLRAGMSDWARLVGPNYWLPRTDTDNIHLKAVSGNRLGQIFAEAIFAEVNGQGWKPLMPTKVTVTAANKIRIDCHVPVPPLVIDTSESVISLTGLQGLYGFDVQAPDGSFLTISSAAVVDNTAIELTMAAPLATSRVRVSYAMRRNSDAGRDDGPILGARGCVRDSYAQASPWESYTLRNWMVMWSIETEVRPLEFGWTAYTPTLVWTGGTPTGAMVSAASYKLIGKTLMLSVEFYDGSALNGATGLTISLPPGLSNVSRDQSLMGFDAGTGGIIFFQASPSATVLTGRFAAAGGLTVDRYYRFGGVMEVA